MMSFKDAAKLVTALHALNITDECLQVLIDETDLADVRLLNYVEVIRSMRHTLLGLLREEVK